MYIYKKEKQIEAEKKETKRKKGNEKAENNKAGQCMVTVNELDETMENKSYWNDKSSISGIFPITFIFHWCSQDPVGSRHLKIEVDQHI